MSVGNDFTDINRKKQLLAVRGEKNLIDNRLKNLTYGESFKLEEPKKLKTKLQNNEETPTPPLIGFNDFAH